MNFDGWFKDSAGFDSAGQGRLRGMPGLWRDRGREAADGPGHPEEGPQPGRRRPAPAAVAARAAPPPLPPPGSSQAAAGPVPAQVVALLQRMRAEVEKNCDYVGPGFAEEARKMHRGESDRRGIYGEASDADTEALQEEGIEFARIPWVPRAD